MSPETLTCPGCGAQIVRSDDMPATGMTCPGCQALIAFQAPGGATSRLDTGKLPVLTDSTHTGLSVEEESGSLQLPEHLKFSLVLMDGSQKGQSLDVTENPFTLGRETGVLALAGKQISRIHASLEVYEDQSVVLRDIGSTNGTFVNGRKIEESKLKDGDVIGLGDVRLRFRAQLV